MGINKKIMKKVTIGILALAIGLVSIITLRGQSPESSDNEENYKILQKWELPEILEEVSAIAWIGENRIACVQDEDGIIFVYNLKTSKLEEKISFGEGGDYEGIAIMEDDAYVLRSDGVIFEVPNFAGGDPSATEYVTNVNQLPGINIEGFCADPANNRLLLAVKERKDLKNRKEIYAFDLSEKNTLQDPLLIIDLADPILEEVNKKLKEKFSPGEIGINPETGEFYILDGTDPKILITKQDGTSKELIMLNIKDFGNPEGLTFSPEGDLYISNEAENGPANILKVSLKRSQD